MNSRRIVEIIQEAGLEDKYEMVSMKEAELDEHLLKIIEHYKNKKTSYFSRCESTAQNLLMTILKDDELKEIHSARYRVKSVESLITKYIKKKALLPEEQGINYNIEKYRSMDEYNYYKIITDLIGIRILVRYQQQWEVVHKWIWDNFFKEDKSYIRNWISDYPSVDTEEFLVEKPKLYLRDEKDLPMYQKFGEDIFEVHISDEGYSSIHYILWLDGKYVELQVRTIYDEAWGECTHDLVYKCKDKSKRAELEKLSECLAIQTQAAGMISDMMFDKSKTVHEIVEIRDLSQKQDSNIDNNIKFQKFEKHIQNISVSQKQKKEFNGAIDDLI